jgi:hypothetical protein
MSKRLRYLIACFLLFLLISSFFFFNVAGLEYIASLQLY